jgi:hypothetical protein
MSIQDMHYAAKVQGVGEKLVAAVKDEDLIKAKSITETYLYLNAGEKVRDSVDGAVQKSAVNTTIDESVHGGGNPMAGMSRATPPQDKLDPKTVAAMLQMFQGLMASQGQQQQGQQRMPGMGMPGSGQRLPQRPGAGRPQSGPRGF